MTENQEKELFGTLAALVTGVNIIQSDVKNLKSDVKDLKSDVHGLKSDVQSIKETQNKHSRILNEHSQILNEHSRILNRLDAKTDSIAETVMTNDKRLTAVEKDVSNLRGGIH